MADRPTAPLAALTLVASLRAALATARSVADRRAGRGDAAESTQGAEESLVLARRRLEASLSHLRVRLALGAPAEPAAALVQAFRDRLLAADLAGDLAEVHRGLMTLYPLVDAELVEAARQSAVRADALAGAIDFDSAAPTVASRLAHLIDHLEGLVRGSARR